MNAKQKTKSTAIELEKRLKVTLITIVCLVGFLYLTFVVFGPKIGFLFGLLSKDKGNNNNELSIKPAVPTFIDLPEATKEKIITITGYSQEGYTIKLFVNGPEKAQTVAGSDGMYTFDNVNLISGKNTIFAKAVDKNNNESDKTDVEIITVDNKAPEIEINTPNNGDTIKNLNKNITIKGKIDEKASITVNGRSAVQKPDLSFDFILGVEEGEFDITIEVTDLAGNVSKRFIHVKYEKTSG